MPIVVPTYEIAVALEGLDPTEAYAAGEPDGYTVHRVTVLHVDQLIGEQAGPRYGLGELKAAPLTYTTLWAWAALRRQGVTVPEFPLFKVRVLSIDEVKRDATEPDPTNLTGRERGLD